MSWRSSLVRSFSRLLGVREYDATKNGNHVWSGRRVTASASADTDLIAARSVLRERSRHAYQNHSSARAIVESLVGLVVATGIDVEPKTGDDQTDDALRQAWIEWREYADAAGKLDLYEIQRQAFRSVVLAGEALIVLHDLEGDRPIPFALSVVEPDQLACEPVAPISTGSRFVDGIEVDQHGRAIAYHLMREPVDGPTQPLGGSMIPGSGGRPIGTIGGNSARGGVRVPSDRVIHIYEVQRPGQTRGEPWLAPVLGTLHQERQLVEAELTAAKIGAAHAVAIVSESQTWPAQGDPNTGTDETGGASYDFAPGSVSRLAPGEKIEIVRNERPSQQISPFRQMLRGDLAGACRVPQRLIDRDVSRANYSSMRADMLDTKRMLDPVQQWFGRLAAAEIYRRALPQLAVYAGVNLPTDQRERRAMARCEIMPDGWAYVDPEKDARAATLAIAAGLSTWEDELHARGKDPRQVWAQLKAEQDQAEAMGIKLDLSGTNAPAPQSSMGEVAPAKPEAPEPAKEETKEDDERIAKRHAMQLELAKAGAQALTINMPANTVNLPAQTIRNEVTVPSQPAPVVNVAPAEVSVTVEPARVEIPAQPAPVVNMPAPVVNVAAPNVTVQPAQVTVENHVTVPQRKVLAKPNPDGSVTMTPQGD